MSLLADKHFHKESGKGLISIQRHPMDGIAIQNDIHWLGNSNQPRGFFSQWIPARTAYRDYPQHICCCRSSVVSKWL